MRPQRLLKRKINKVWIVYRIEHLVAANQTMSLLKYEASFTSESAAYKQAEYSLEVFGGAIVVLPVITDYPKQ